MNAVRTGQFGNNAERIPQFSSLLVQRCQSEPVIEAIKTAIEKARKTNLKAVHWKLSKLFRTE